MEEIKLQSGKILKLEFAGFDEASELRNIIEEELLKVDINLSNLDSGLDLMNMEINSDTLNCLKKHLFILDSSRELRKALFECLKRCTYDKERITKELFSTEEAVSDYFEIMGRCIIKNLLPFFKNLRMKLPSLNKMKESFLNSNSTEA